MADVAAADIEITTEGKPGERLTVLCAFCKGTGKDRFGLLSRLSDCQNCLGRGEVRIPAPARACPFCNASGVHHRNQRLTCLACGGTGSVTVPERLEACPRCHGRGAPLIPEGREQAGRIDYFPCLTCRGKGVVRAGAARSVSIRAKAIGHKKRPRKRTKEGIVILGVEKIEEKKDIRPVSSRGKAIGRKMRRRAPISRLARAKKEGKKIKIIS